MTERHKNLKAELKHITTANLMSPFPVFDTEYVEMVQLEINKIEDVCK